jgi:hypothetical protein
MNGRAAIANGRIRRIRARMAIGHLLDEDTLRQARAVLWGGESRLDAKRSQNRSTMPTEERHVKWVTREHPKTDRIACPWLIRTFIDPAAEIVYLPADQVLAFAEREGAISFDATGARYTHRDGLCSFEVLVEEYRLSSDPALALLARVIHGADVSEDRDVTPQSRGLLAIADGFSCLDLPDERQLELELPVYDALYAWARREIARRAD